MRSNAGIRRLVDRLPRPAAPSSDSFTSPLHDPRVTSRVGVILGAGIAVCFVTGVISHLQQHPLSWLPLPTGPAWGYRLTQGLHVAVGLALIPLFFVKVWTVYPKLYQIPRVRSATHALERLSVALLVASTLFQLVTGVFNIVHWYPWPFFFTTAHFAVAWVVAGSVLLHLSVQWPRITASLARSTAADAPGDDAEAPPSQVAGDSPVGSEPVAGGMSRRALFAAAAASVGVITLTTLGQSVRRLEPFAVLSPRLPRTSPGGIPINRTAREARVAAAALHPGYHLVVAGLTELTLTLADLAARAQTTVRLPIACVEGWSADGVWTGVRLSELLEEAGVAPGTTVRVVSLERGGLYAASEVVPSVARDPRTLLALRLGGEQLTLDHGFPVRLVAPNRPGVLQTKWVARVEPT